MTKNKRKVKKVKLPFPTWNQKQQAFQEQLECLQIQIDRHSKELQAISESHATHISLLGSFASHDLKNYIHSIDGIVSAYDANEITNEQLQSIKYNIDLMRETLKNFSKLVIHGDDNSCDLNELIEAITILNRGTMAEQGIDFSIGPIEQYITFQVPFTSMLQLLNNLIINATKAMTEQQNKKIHLKICVDDSKIEIALYDNGMVIDPEYQPKLFDYGFSNTGGSGIGLYHAKYLCNLYNGSIECIPTPNHDFTKGFVIKLPIIKDNS